MQHDQDTLRVQDLDERVDDAPGEMFLGLKAAGVSGAGVNRSSACG